MSDAFVGEIRMFGGTFAPVGWVLCNGQLLPIAQYDVLFTLLGTTYGGDGQTTFAVPNLQGRIPVHFGNVPSTGMNYALGATGGVENVTLTPGQMPAHTHVAVAQEETGTLNEVTNAVWANTALKLYTATPPNAAMSAGLLSAAGGSQPHDNMMPYLAVNFIIATEGIFPTQG